MDMAEAREMNRKEQRLKILRAIAQHGNNVSFQDVVKYSGVNESDAKQIVDELLSGGYLDKNEMPKLQTF